MTEQSLPSLGLRQATAIGVGAIVGGGILVLAGVAFEATGPSAVIAFAINGLVALLTAMSFAELSTAFPESGGAYTFAKKILSVRAAFAVGWILWFAYIVAGVLYALGFSAFATLFIQSALEGLGAKSPEWLATRNTSILLAILAISVYCLMLIRKSSGGGNWATVGKVVVFVVLIIAGVAAVLDQSVEASTAALTPFFYKGGIGLLTAMGFTFIALQGFDLIATIAGEVRDPRRNIPRAMFLSLGTALAIYLPLLVIVALVGVPEGMQIAQIAAENPDTVIAIAVKNYMGPVGYWLVIVAAILATLSALHANILAASRVALSMAHDQTLPRFLCTVHPTRHTPLMAVYATGLTLVAITLMIPNLSNAGAAASLIFLVSFALTHAITYLARKRMGAMPHAFKTPFFPVVPVVGGVACALLAVFQAINVPDAGFIALLWLGLGSLLYLGIFSREAELVDASAEGHDPTLVKLRGRSPFVLLPVANPARARAMVDLASAMAPSHVGRVLLLSVVTPHDEKHVNIRLDEAQDVIREALGHSYQDGQTPEALITRAPDAWEEIRRIAAEHQCESLMLGLGQLNQPHITADLSSLINQIGCDVALVKGADDWSLAKVERILVPVAGRGREHGLRARLLGALCRDTHREVTFLCVVPTETSERGVEEYRRNIARLAEAKLQKGGHVQITKSDAPDEAILAASKGFDLIIMGLGRMPHTDLLKNPALKVAHEAACATILLSRRTSRLNTPIDASWWGRREKE